MYGFLFFLNCIIPQIRGKYKMLCLGGKDALCSIGVVVVWSCFPKTKRASRRKPLCGFAKMVRECENSGIYRTSLIVCDSHNSARGEDGFLRDGGRPEVEIGWVYMGSAGRRRFPNLTKPGTKANAILNHLLCPGFFSPENTARRRNQRHQSRPLTTPHNSWYVGIGKKRINKRQAKGETV